VRTRSGSFRACVTHRRDHRGRSSLALTSTPHRSQAAPAPHNCPIRNAQKRDQDDVRRVESRSREKAGSRREKSPHQPVAPVCVRYDPHCVRARPKLPSMHGIPRERSPLVLQQQTARVTFFEADPVASVHSSWMEKCRAPKSEIRDRRRAGPGASTRPTLLVRSTIDGTA
jgi:hypothetical protein